MDTANRVQILDEAVYIPHSVNTFWKGMNPTILPPAILSPEVGQTGIFNLGMATGLGERKVWIQTC